MVKPLTRLVGLPARRSGGVAGELANANSVRNPSRTASTAAALMIGLTLVTVVAVLGAGMRNTVESAVTDQVTAAYILNGNDGEPFEAAEGDALARVPGVTAASHVRVDKALVAGKEQDVTGVDPATIARFYNFDWTDGSDAAARPTRQRRRARDADLRRRPRPAGRRPAARSRPRRATSSASPSAASTTRPRSSRCSARSASPSRRSTRRSRSPRTCSPSSTPEPDANQALDRGVGRLQRRRRTHRRRLRERLHEGLCQLPELPLRAAGVLGRREPVRHGQHARAQRVRAHTRARDAADDRDDPSAGAPDDPPRERHHGADRRRPRAPARHLPRRAGHPGAVASTTSRSRSRSPSSSPSRSSPSSPASRRRSCRPAAPPGSTSSTRCTTSDPGAPCRSVGVKLMESTTHEIRASAAAEAILQGTASAR